MPGIKGPDCAGEDIMAACDCYTLQPTSLGCPLRALDAASVIATLLAAGLD